MVRRVREMLSFQAQAGMLQVRLARLSARTPIEIIAAVELNRRFGREDLECPTAGRFVKFRREFQLLRAAVQDKVVVIAVREEKLFVAFVNPSANGNGFAEVERRPGHAKNLPGRNGRWVDGRETRGGQLQLMIENGAISRSGQIEICVVRQIHDRRSVGGGTVLDLQVAVRQGKANRRVQISRKPFLAVSAE